MVPPRAISRRPRSESSEHHAHAVVNDIVNGVVNSVDFAASGTYCGVIEFDDETRVSWLQGMCSSLAVPCSRVPANRSGGAPWS
jgi:hypothetical protein